ncbi:hypothetical protein [Planomicrobium sp. Y74]|uniref:hypothetical protein n=1 Tax=Planomicrobium sp. Y74 TaxID=2478977 RepID=UPI000EF5048B|nr:hypothetical protein [Planomicrobium sp. Y74]RLQ91546.1 hypothetical protein D9754_07425 [Planomicrobium sp. Y74]
MVEFILEIMIEISSYFFTPKKRLEKNIRLLKKDHWFAELEDDFRYNHLIWNNRKITRFLGVPNNVEKLIKDDDEKAKFKKLLTYEHVKFITLP